jgi:hypothetical protein
MGWTRADAEVACQGTDANVQEGRQDEMGQELILKLCQGTYAKVREERQDVMDKS